MPALQGMLDYMMAQRIYLNVEATKQLIGFGEKNPDGLISLAGRVPDDLPAIIHEEPTGMPQLWREAKGMTAERLRELREQIRRIKGEGEK